VQTLHGGTYHSATEGAPLSRKVWKTTSVYAGNGELVRALQAIEDVHHGTVFSIFESAEDQRKMIVYYVEDRTDARA
jgi:hypothetical protein